MKSRNSAAFNYFIKSFDQIIQNPDSATAKLMLSMANLINSLNISLSFLTCWIIGYQVTYPNMMEFFETLGVDMELSDMSFSVSLDEGRGCEWGSRNGLSSLFAQKKNILNPYFWQMIREMVKFKDDVLK